MSTYRQLKQRIAELEKKAAIAMKHEVKNVIESVKKQIAEFGLSAADLGLEIARRAGAKTVKAKKRVLAPKYRDPTTGKTWNGNGKRPGWIVAAQERGKLDELLIARPALAKSAPQAKAATKAKAARKKKLAPQARTAARFSVRKSRKKAAPAAKAVAKEAPRKPAARVRKKAATAAKAVAPKLAAKKLAKPLKKAPILAAKPASPVTTAPAAVAP